MLKPKGLSCEAAPMVLTIPYPARFRCWRKFSFQIEASSTSLWHIQL